MNLAPITLFTYNRLEYTQKTVESLQKNTLAKDSLLFVFSDGPKNKTDIGKVTGVRNYIKSITGFKDVKIIERKTNLGLANSIIQGVTEVVNHYGKIIVMEDDLVSSPYFLEFMNEGLEFYKNENKIISVHGYIYPTKEKLPETFFLRGADCWGWATWKRGWDIFESDGKKLLKELEVKNLTKKFNLDGSFHFTEMLKKQIDGKNNSWAIRWYASAYLANKLTLYPGKSLINNIGQDHSGTHKSHSPLFATEIYKDKINIRNIPVEENIQARKILIKYLKSLRLGIFRKIKKKLKDLIR